MTTKGPAARADMGMDGARRQFLARARRADDQDAAVGRRDLFDGLAQMDDRARACRPESPNRRQLLEFFDLALEPRGFQRAVGDQHQPVGLERLLDEVVGALLDRRDGGFDVAVAGDHHHRQIRMLGLDVAEQLQAVELAALQPDVEEDQVRPPRRDCAQRVVAVARGAGGIAFVFEDAGRPVRGCRLRRRRSGCRKPFALLDSWFSCSSLVGSVRIRRRSAAASRRRAGREFVPPHREARCAPPCSSRILPTMARPRPVPFSRVVT